MTVLRSYDLDHTDSIDGNISVALLFGGTAVMALFVPGLLFLLSRQGLKPELTFVQPEMKLNPMSEK